MRGTEREEESGKNEEEREPNRRETGPKQKYSLYLSIQP